MVAQAQTSFWRVCEEDQQGPKSSAAASALLHKQDPGRDGAAGSVHKHIEGHYPVHGGLACGTMQGQQVLMAVCPNFT